MKKLLLLLSLLLSILTVSAQKIIRTERVTDHSIHVVGDNFEGMLFLAPYTYRGEPDEIKSSNRFTPTNAEISTAEEILQIQLADKHNRHSHPERYDVSGNLNSYLRQYLGYVSKNGKRIIYINSFLNHDYYPLKQAHIGHKQLNIPNWYNEVIVSFGGGDAFWRATINLTDKRLESFEINAPK